MGNNLLKGKKGIIFGALNEMSIAWKIAEKAKEQGAEITLSNTPIAARLGDIDKLGEKCNAKIILGDATNIKDIENIITKSLDALGGKIDFVLHSIAMSTNVRKGRTYNNLDYNYYAKTLDISAISFHKLLHTCHKMDAINEWGSVLGLSYIAAQRTLFGYNDMAEAKAMLESIARSFGYIYGKEKKVRVNTISQSPIITTAGKGIKGIEELIDFTERMSPLGNSSAEECANYCIMMFSDFTKKVTMQNLFHDGGYSSMGMSSEVMDQYSKSFNL